MGSGNASQNVSTVPMVFSESGWSWFRGSQKGEQGSPNWASGSEDNINDSGENVPSLFTPTQMIAPSQKQEGDGTDMNSFSTSLPDLFQNRLGISDEEPPLPAQLEEDDEKELSLEELELHTIGNLLPDDEDLFSGISSGFDCAGTSSNAQETEEYDLFGNGGGLELGLDVHHHGSALFSSFGGERVSRTLFVRNLDSNLEDNELKDIFERYGDVRSLYTAYKHEGLVMVSYFDIRAAKRALRALHGKISWHQKLDVQFLISKDLPSDKEVNQGILVLFNLDPSFSNDDLGQIFSIYGDIREIRDAPHRHHHRLLEFYDVRAAEAARRALNRCEKRLKLDAGASRRSLILQLSQEIDQEAYCQHNQPSIFSTRGQVGSILGNGSFKDLYNPSPLINTHQHPPHHHPHHHPNDGNAHSYPELEYHMRASSPVAISSFRSRDGVVDDVQRCSNPYIAAAMDHRGGLRSASVGRVTSSGLPFVWGTTTQVPSQQQMWPGSGHVYGGGGGGVASKAYGQLERSRERRRGYRESYVNVVGFRSSSNEVNYLNQSQQRTSKEGRTSTTATSSSSVAAAAPTSASGSGSMGRFNRHRSRRGDNTCVDNEQYHLVLERITSGEDARTTLMLKNIPNKYTSKMLLAVIDESNAGTYDFIYLPIDFKNKCNVGYAFINMIEPAHIVALYKAFNGKKWEKFNSEKVASLAYARIQGKAALIAHFQNSNLMNEDKRCRPILFETEAGVNGAEQFKDNGIVMEPFYCNAQDNNNINKLEMSSDDGSEDVK